MAYNAVGPTGAVINVGPGDFPGFSVWYQNVTIVGAGPGSTVIDGGNAADSSYTPGTSTVTFFDLSEAPLPGTLSQLQITGGNNNSNCIPPFGDALNQGYSCGGGIANYFGQLTLNHVTVTNNDALTGAGIYNAGYLSLNSSTVTANYGGAGGGIYNDNPAVGNIANFGQVQLNSTQVTNNLAYTGGGIFNYTGGGQVALNTSTLSGNAAGACLCSAPKQPEFNGFGGGVYNYGGSLSVTNSKLTGNSSTSTGGAVANGGFPDFYDSWLPAAQTTITGSSVSNNQASVGAGLANLFFAGITVNNSPSNKSVVSSNQASEAGGGVFNLYGGSVQVNGAQIVNNTAANEGGGLLNAASGALTITGALVKGNLVSSGNGGGIANECGGALNLTNTMVQSNTATGGAGGGLFFDSTYPPTLSGDTFNNNKPDNTNGGSVY